MSLPDPPASGLSPKVYEWRAGTLMHRVHDARRAGNVFNPCKGGTARVSPFHDARGKGVPFLYGGADFPAACFETIFRDLPETGTRTVPESVLTGRAHSTLNAAATLFLADLTSDGEGHLGHGFSGHTFSTCPARDTMQTIAWAAAIYRHCPTLHGLIWVPYQTNTRRAVVLWQPRLHGTRLIASPRVRLDTGTGRVLVGKIADEFNITFTLP